MVEYEPVIGMEVHVELQTNSKMFCGCAVDFGGEPNTRCCPVCLGLPGSLPVVNERAIELMAKTALALNCTVTPQCIFHRKNYYYPDLPKNYQISQYDFPLGVNGYVEILAGGKPKKIAIRRVHMEEDTGKLLHVEGNRSHVDYNRSGVPLMEIVTMNPPPVGFDQIESAEEAREYLQRLRQILLYLGVSDCKMEEGSMRCEPNISIKPKGQIEFGTKTEIKNLNSFRAVYLGVDYELKRQEKVLNEGGKIVQETRRWDDSRGATASMRSKEVEQEYRYFPEPDLVPLRFTDDWIGNLRSHIPELPLEKVSKYVREDGIARDDAETLTDSPQIAGYYEESKRSSGLQVVRLPSLAHWLTGPFLSYVNEHGYEKVAGTLTPRATGTIVRMMEDGTINRNVAKQVGREVIETGKEPELIVKERGLEQVTDTSEIESAINRVIANNPGEVERFRAGEERLAGWFVGQVMRETKGKANPGVVNELLKERLKG